MTRLLINLCSRRLFFPDPAWTRWTLLRWSPGIALGLLLAECAVIKWTV